MISEDLGRGASVAMNGEVILVEDDPSVLRAMRRLISSEGLSVRAFDRPSALQPSEIPATNACLIFDIHLPEMSGLELYECLQASGCRLPLILVTGYMDEETRRMTTRADAMKILSKPVSRRTLLAAIREALTR